jgi:hypothetical protein
MTELPYLAVRFCFAVFIEILANLIFVEEQKIITKNSNKITVLPYFIQNVDIVAIER